VSPDVPVVLGLDLVADDGWARALPHLAEPAVARALFQSVVVHPVSGRSVSVPGPSAWWLREAPLFGGIPPVSSHRADAEPVVAALYPTTVPEGLADARLLAAIGVRGTVAEILAEPEGPAELLARLADPDLTVEADQVVAAYRALARLPEDRWPDPPDRVRVPSAGRSRVVGRAEVTVVTAPHHLPLAGDHALPGPPELAELLDADVWQERSAAGPSGGVERPVPDAVRTWLTGVPDSYTEHDDLRVDGQSVAWWVTAAGDVHASTVDGLARAIAWAASSWHSRHEIAALLDDPTRADELAAETAFD
jgi:hypothetical protein